MQLHYFDLETAALPADEILSLMPEFKAPGNYRDPEKIKASIAEQQEKWLADGALSAVTGRILCIGWSNQVGGYQPIVDDSEKAMLEKLWGRVETALWAGDKVIGYCSTMFDWPFAIRRSYKHAVRVPSTVFQGRYLSDNLIDVAERWNRGNKEPISLDALSKFLGIGQKNGTGKDFAALWTSDRTKALEYLRGDLELTRMVWERMQ